MVKMFPTCLYIFSNTIALSSLFQLKITLPPFNSVVRVYTEVSWENYI
jgi:hypothetical protein